MALQSAQNVIEITRAQFLKVIDGKQVDLYSIQNEHGVVIKITNYGAKVEQILLPDRNGEYADIVLGFDSIEKTIAGQPSMGAFIGRYSNRIAGAQFTLGEETYKLVANSGVNSLHGGKRGSRFQVFDARQLSPSAVEFKYVFKDGEENFPGTLPVTVRYSLNDHNEFAIEWEAIALDKPTVASFTNHTYFNLAGNPSSPITDCLVTINADQYLPVDKNLIPTGKLADVTDTPFDFRKPRLLAQDINSDHEQIRRGNGYDHHFALNTHAQSGELSFAARVLHPQSGRTIEVYTTEPGIQLFTGNNLSGNIPLDAGKDGKKFAYRSGICLEPSYFPDSPNHPNFPDTTLQPGESYIGKIIYKFGVEEQLPLTDKYNTTVTGEE
jgi:aldose 1-epimerase